MRLQPNDRVKITDEKHFWFGKTGFIVGTFAEGYTAQFGGSVISLDDSEIEPVKKLIGVKDENVLTELNRRALVAAKEFISDLPGDTVSRISLPTIFGDNRVWFDLVSDQYAHDTAEYGGYMEEPWMDPVVDQMILVPTGVLQAEAPDFYKRFIQGKEKHSVALRRTTK